MPSAATPAHASARPTFSRRSTLRSRSPTTNAHLAARKKYTYAAFFLVVSLVSFTVQTELAKYIQQDLGWNKAYCMLYLTHGSWSLLWPAQLLVLRLQKRDQPWQAFWRRHVWLLRTTAQMVERQDLDVPRACSAVSPLPYLIRTTALVTVSLTVAGLSWYVAVDMTTPSDLTAIYNCSAFFAYAFSVPLLKERLRFDKSFAVLIAIVGVLVVAYGDSGETTQPPGAESSRSDIGADAFLMSSASTRRPDSEVEGRFWGNVVIGIGSVLYGLYEVLYKRYACPPEGCSPGRGMIFANAFGSLIGSFTLLVLWVPLPLLHVLGIETFELPVGSTAWYLFLSVIMNALFAGSFLVLISLTSPVLSSVAALLTIFIVAISDWFITGKPPHAAAVLGGAMIIVAFAMLSWSTWREMAAEEKRKAVDLSESGDDEEESESE
ncbi:Duf6 domain-containing protein [Pleurostoma richardsiae]|uniref:Duf6 domain-containing protein n=1 Tax=Pleurostoma richardsiae TaxID=41990 RepID=A0AA38RND4_9PEZI|nr:Duf6 domain-containing protein [Pleurostoma richardsiae]